MKNVLLFLLAVAAAAAQSFPVKTNASGVVTEPAAITLPNPSITGNLTGTTGTGHSFTSTFTAPVNDNVHFLSLWPVLTSAGAATDLRALSIDAELTGSVDAAGVRSQRLRAMTSVGSSANVGILQGSSNSQTHQGSGLVSLMSGYQGSMNLWGPGNATLVEYFRANVPNLTSTGRILGDTKGLAIYNIGTSNSTGVYGAWVDDLTKPTASEAYGYWTQMSAGAGGKWAFYGAGSAPSYFGGAITASNGITFLGKTGSDTSVALAGLAATGVRLYTNTTHGGVLVGYGTTYDVSLLNRNADTALGVVAGTNTVSVPSSTASTSTTSGALVVTGGIGIGGNTVHGGYTRWTGNSMLPGQGSIGKDATYGLNLYAATGSTYDFTLFNAAGGSVMTVPTGTSNAAFSGNVTASGTTHTFGSGAGSPTFALNGAAGSYKYNIYRSGGFDRWYAGVAAGAESGSNSGAAFVLTALTDAGAVIDSPISIVRASGGGITFSRPITASTTAYFGASAQLVGSATWLNSGGGGTFNFINGATVANTLRFGIGDTNQAYLTNTGLQLLATTASTNSTTGALVVGGGVGIAGNLNIGGTLGATDAAGRLRVTSGGFASYGSLTLGANYAAMGGGFQTSYDSPTTRIFYGDGSGFDLRFSTRASSTTTDRMTLTDTGNLTLSGSARITGIQNTIGTASQSANFPLRINQGNTNAQVNLELTNEDAGSSASASFQIVSDAGASTLRQHSAAHSIWPSTLVLSASDALAINTGAAADPIRFYTGGVERMRVISTGIVTQNGVASTPASATAAGTAGEIRWDANYVYVCVATNTWKRAALSTW